MPDLIAVVFCVRLPDNHQTIAIVGCLGAIAELLLHICVGHLQLLESLLKLFAALGTFGGRIRHPVRDVMHVRRYPQKLREIRLCRLMNSAEYSLVTGLLTGCFSVVVHKDCRITVQTTMAPGRLLGNPSA